MKSEDIAKPSHFNVMTVREVSSYLHVHPTTIYRLLKRNQIRPFTSAVTGGSTSNPSTTGYCSSKRSRND